MNVKSTSTGDSARTPGPRERIVAAAMDLFYRKGYASTSVDEVIERAAAYKKSFYRYFPSREDLGQEYLRAQADFFFGFFDSMLGRHDTFEEFLSAWMRILRRDARKGLFIGCPFASFASDIKSSGPAYETCRTSLKSIVELRRKKLTVFLQSCTIQGRSLPAEYPVRDLADRVIQSYQGGIALFALSGDQTYIRRLEKEILFVVQATVSGLANDR